MELRCKTEILAIVVSIVVVVLICRVVVLGIILEDAAKAASEFEEPTSCTTRLLGDLWRRGLPWSMERGMEQ
jgi:hypothetical protein